METVLITGGAGYVGTNLIYYLLENKHNVVVIDKLSNSNARNLFALEKYFKTKIKYYDFDLNEQQKLEEVIKQNNISCVVHLAGKKYVQESLDFPNLYLKGNLEMTSSLLKAMANCKIKKLVFASTIQIFGIPKILPINENTQIAPSNPYGQSKALCERLISNFAQEDSTRCVSILRFANIVGARTTPVVLGDSFLGKYKNIFDIVHNCIKTNTPLSINGKNHKTKDGTTERDYIHIQDLTKVVYDICLNNKAGLNYYTIGNGSNTTSVLDIVKSFEKQTNKKIKIIVGKARIGDADVLSTDNSKIVEDFGYKQTMLLDDMVKSVIEFNRRINQE